MVFLSQKVDGKMIFTDYWKVIVLIFSGMRNAVFFWAKKLMERWYLLITEKFLFWTFQEWEIQSFLIQKVSEKIIFTDYWNVLVLNFLGMENTACFWSKKLMERWYLLVTEKFLFWTFRWWEIQSFFQPKSWWKDDIYLVFLSFPWYSRTWEIRFFVQCSKLTRRHMNNVNQHDFTWL